MTETSSEWKTVNGLCVFVCAEDGKKLWNDRDAVELIGEVVGQNAALVVIPTERFNESFFHLKTRVAGEILQKFVQYGVRVAIVGDISRYTEDSSSLRDFVRDPNRSDTIWFAATFEEIENRLRNLTAPGAAN
jgi:hypothetical protein